MMKSATLRARVEPDLKDKAESILTTLGLSATDAITLFYAQIVLRKGLPFAVEIPNRLTRRTFAKTDAGEDLHAFGTGKEMMESLGL